MDRYPTYISQRYEHKPEHWQFIRNTGLHREDFKPIWLRHVNVDAIVLCVSVAALILALTYIWAVA